MPSKLVLSVRYTGWRWKYVDLAYCSCASAGGERGTQYQRLSFYIKDEKKIKEDLSQCFEAHDSDPSYSMSGTVPLDQGKRLSLSPHYT